MSLLIQHIRSAYHTLRVCVCTGEIHSDEEDMEEGEKVEREEEGELNAVK